MRGVHHFHPPMLPGCSWMYKMTQKRVVGHGRERWEKGRRSGKSTKLLVRLVTEFLTKYCMVAYKCNV